MKFTLTHISLGLATLLLVIGCTQPTSVTQEGVLKVGSLNFLTNNPYVRVASEFQRGLEIYKEQAETEITIITEDDQMAPKMSVTATRKLLEIDGVDIILTPLTEQAKPIGPIVQQAKVPAIVYWESSPKIENLGDHFFGVGLWQPSAGRNPAKFAKEQWDAKKMAIIYDQNEWADLVVKYFKEEFQEEGREIVEEISVLNETSDFRTQIAKLKAKNPDVIFCALGYHPDLFFKQLKEIGFDGQILSTDQIVEELIESSSGGMEGLYFSNADDQETDGLKNLKERYIEAYGEDPSSIYQVALAYDALHLAVESWKKDPKNLRKAIAETKNLRGALGEMSINENRSHPRKEVMFKIENGEVKHLTK